ncbi:flagellar biosynthetic protein FliO [Vibrio mangrovi]|uniref:Flagellar protein n=1 Tax=Vibrio mangrovi TaxID=474394 RepID=A0A1Y6IUH3_9VIBR|nr:flagellar biosynthetic protein FliO [Vibrio mangrovi]MDW6001507.1 flagellar biosynthetic protein FliO [Vibrio mangrovi]SMS00470.1 Flagellar protein FliO [Vibrio mangrovi]
MKRLIILLFCSFPVWAETGAQMSILTTFGALIFVVAFILILAFLLKKMRLPALGGSQKDLMVIRQLPIGTKEKLLVVQVGEEQFLVGATAHSIRLISKLEQPLTSSSQTLEHPFAGQLNRFLKKE